MPSVLTKYSLCKAWTFVLTLVLYGTHGVCLKNCVFSGACKKTSIKLHGTEGTITEGIPELKLLNIRKWQIASYCFVFLYYE